MTVADDSWKFYGPEAILVEFGGSETVARKRVTSAFEAIQARPPSDLRECVPGFSKLLLVFNPSARSQLPARAASLVEAILENKPRHQRKPRLHEIEVIYDGPDLDFVCSETGLSRDRVIALHSRPIYTVCFLGFTPGFPYLAPLDKRLHLPRRPDPRKRVQPGSVAIGGPHTGIYPIASPGGWHLLGHTDALLFRPDATPEKMFLLAPGDQVRFKPVEAFLPNPAPGRQP